MRINHYRGFIDTCQMHGMTKAAADLMYKSAGLISGVGSLFGYGARAGKVVGTGVAGAVHTGGRMLYRIPDVTISAGDWALGQTGRGLRYVGNEFARGYRAVNPLPPGTPAPSLPKHMFAPMGAIKMFTRKHPKTALLLALGGGAYVTHLADTGDDDDRKALLPTMTPSEQAAYDRYMSGMNLPGLGLDPVLFNGSYSSYL